MLLHEGAVYLHDGEPYLVERLDWEEGHAWVRPAAVDYYTVATSSQEVRVIWRRTRRATAAARATPTARCRSSASVSSYRQVKLRTHETLGVGQIDLPEQVLETDAWWLAFGDELLDPLRAAGPVAQRSQRLRPQLAAAAQRRPRARRLPLHQLRRAGVAHPPARRASQAPLPRLRLRRRPQRGLPAGQRAGQPG